MFDADHPLVLAVAAPEIIPKYRLFRVQYHVEYGTPINGLHIGMQ